LQLETLNGENFLTPMSDSQYKEYRAWEPLTFKQEILSGRSQGKNCRTMCDKKIRSNIFICR
jgi:hypothetical protein